LCLCGGSFSPLPTRGLGVCDMLIPEVWMRVPGIGIAHCDVVSRAVWRTYSYLNMIANDQHLEVPSSHFRVYSPAQGLYGPIYLSVSLLRPAKRQLSTHPGDTHLRAPPRARANPSACTLTTRMWTRDHTLAPRLATSHRAQPRIPPQGGLCNQWLAEQTPMRLAGCATVIVYPRV
jgi:hypothetical protein